MFCKVLKILRKLQKRETAILTLLQNNLECTNNAFSYIYLNGKIFEFIIYLSLN